jgi:hypothetical protein
MSCLEIQEGCKQCKMLLDINYKLAHENGTLKRGREIQRDVMGKCAKELQEFLPNDVLDFSNRESKIYNIIKQLKA